MSYVNTAVSMISDEKTFITTFIDSITSSNSHITRTSSESTCEDIYDAATGTPTFTLKIDNNFELVFRRDDDVSNGSYEYYIDINNLLRNTQEQSTLSLMFSDSSFAANDNIQRTWKYQIASNNKTLFLSIGAYNVTMPSDPTLNLISVFDSLSVNATAYADSGHLAINNSFYFSNNTSGVIFDRLQYIYNSADSTEIEIIRNKIALLDNYSPSTRANIISGIYDCSKLNVVMQPLIVGTDTYFGLNQYTIMQC